MIQAGGLARSFRTRRGTVDAQGSTALPVLLRELEAARIALESVEVHRPTLDDVFLTVTGRSLRDAESGAPSGTADAALGTTPTEPTRPAT